MKNVVILRWGGCTILSILCRFTDADIGNIMWYRSDDMDDEITNENKRSNMYKDYMLHV